MATKGTTAHQPFEEWLRESIQTPKDAAAYLSAAAEDGDTRVLLKAIKAVIDVHGGLSGIARQTKLNRANLHRALTGKGSLSVENFNRVIRASGLSMKFQPLPKKKKATG